MMTERAFAIDVVAQSEQVVDVAKPVRINVNLTADAYETLKQMSDAQGMDMSEFVRNALRVYNALQQEKSKKKHVYIGTPEKIEKELLIP